MPASDPSRGDLAALQSELVSRVRGLRGRRKEVRVVRGRKEQYDRDTMGGLGTFKAELYRAIEGDYGLGDIFRDLARQFNSTTGSTRIFGAGDAESA